MLTRQEKISKIKEYLSKTKIDTNVTNSTLGGSYSNISPQLMLAASSKLIKINKREVEPDDRDNLKYFQMHGVEDFIKERIDRDADKLQKKLLWKTKLKKNLDPMTPGFFTPQIRSMVIGNTIAELPEQVNPLELVDRQMITKLGPGGISDTTAAPDEARHVHSSYFGFLDPVRTEESLNVGLTYRPTHNTIKTKDNKLMALVEDKKGNKVWKTHEELLNSIVEIPEWG
jgi:DNA-directed RNA polymerase beta subunit